MDRHMLLVGGSRDVHPKAKQLGLRPSLLFDMSTLKNRKKMDIYDRVIGLPVTAEIQEWIDIARVLHHIDPFDCIGGFNEATQEYAAVIAHILKLPFHTADVICYTRQKNKMREVLRKAGLDDTASCLINNTNDLLAFGNTYGYPFVLKPVDGRGSLSISIIRSSQDIPAAVAWFKRWSPERCMLAEQFLAGEEFSVEAFSEKGQHRVICITQKFKDPITCVETGHCLPALLADETQIAIKNLVINMLTAIGLENGPSHTEVIVTPHGPRIVETHARLAGDNIVELIQLASGVDLDELWIRQCAGESVLNKIPCHLHRFAAISFVTPKTLGTLERIDGISEAAATPGVVQVELLQEPGNQMQGAHDSNSRGACAIAVGDTANEAIAQAHHASGCLRFVVSCKGDK